MASQAKQVGEDSLKLEWANLASVAKKKASDLVTYETNGLLRLLETSGVSSESKDIAKDRLTKALQETLGTTDKKITDKIIEYATKHKVDLETAIEEVSKDNQVSDEEKAQIQAGITNFTNLIGKLYKDGALKIDEAKALLSNVNLDNIDTSNINKEGLALLEALGIKVDKTTGKIKEAKDKVNGNDPKNVDTSSIPREASKIDEALNSLVNSVTNAITSIFNSTPKSVKGIGKKGTGVVLGGFRSNGGIIPEYHSDGDIIGVDWKPRGTDTVPTMLTPGEYVLRKKAVESLGLNFLNNLNKYGNKALQSNSGQTIINNVYNTNNAKISQNIDNKSQYLNGLFGIDRLMRYV